MSYEATVYNVMIASPSDVKEERQTIREAIFEWNYKNSHANRMVLMPLGWETHSAPLLAEKEGNGGQGVINDMVLKPADVLVAIFKRRIGSPTKRADSGTIEEIELHSDRGNHVLIYFSKQSIINRLSLYLLFALNKLSSCLGKATKCSKTVYSYKEECKKKGLIYEYDDCKELREQFYGHLQIVVNLIKEKALKPTPEKPIIGSSGESLTIIDDRVPFVSIRVKELVKEILNDSKGQLRITRLREETKDKVVIEANNKEFPDSEEILRHLEREKWIKKTDSDGSIFVLTDLGHQEAVRLGII